MTVSDLIAELSSLPGDMDLVMAADAEGNGYSPMGGFYTAFFDEDEQSVHDAHELHEGDELPEVVVLWPV